MCGFICVYNSDGGLKSSDKRLKAAGRLLNHRGPDDEGFYMDDYFGVHFNRLSIMDPSNLGHQPMISDDGRYVLVFNGEIYNAFELRKKLKDKNYSFKSKSSDTEVLLKLFVEYGNKACHQLRGMFAFVVWDKRAQILYAYRDRIGIKPLYLAHRNRQLIFSSEVKAILGFSSELNRINSESVYKYIARGWVDTDQGTFFQDIKQLSPGSCATVRKDKLDISKYWSLEINDPTSNNLDEFKQEFETTIKQHLQTDVSYASTLSGGMDSSSIVSVAARLLPSPDHLTAFSVLPEKTIDESCWINRTIEHTGINHHYINLDNVDITSTIEKILCAHDEPFENSSCIFQFLLRKKVASNGIKVLLVGEGADEVLGGYRRLFYPFLHSLWLDNNEKEFQRAVNGGVHFMEMTKADIYANLKSYRKMLEENGSGQQNNTAYSLMETGFQNSYSFIKKEKDYPVKPGKYKNYFFAHLARHILKRDLPYILKMEDRNSMAHSVESRVPFLDHVFIEKIFSYHYSLFMKDGQNKYILRKGLEEYLHKDVVGRKSKSGRPGNNAYLIYHVLNHEMIEKTQHRTTHANGFWNKDIARLYRIDTKTRNIERADLWLRFYLLEKWFHLNKLS